MYENQGSNTIHQVLQCLNLVVDNFKFFAIGFLSIGPFCSILGVGRIKSLEIVAKIIQALYLF